MSTLTDDKKKERDKLKAVAFQKIEQAHAALCVAREALRNLEGIGCCECYEEVGLLNDKLSNLSQRVHRLWPTGVFQP